MSRRRWRPEAKQLPTLRSPFQHWVGSLNGRTLRKHEAGPATEGLFELHFDLKEARRTGERGELQAGAFLGVF